VGEQTESGDQKVTTKGRQPQVVSTQRQAEKARPGTWKVKGAIGLYLMVSTALARTGAFHYPRLDNPKKTREMGLRPFSSLDALKTQAKAAHALRRAGEDPIEAREQERLEKAKAEAEADAIASAAAAAKEKPVTFAAKDLNQRRARDGKETARRVRQRIAQVIDMATALGQFTLANPAAPGPISKIKPLRQRGERAHFRRIANLNDAPADIRPLIAAFNRNRSSQLAAYLLMTACGLRPSEFWS
jgi:hypothetical protein